MNEVEEALSRKKPRPHRCNDRVEDFVQALVSWEIRAKALPAWGQLRKCFKSEVGNEPKDPYLVIKDGSKYLDPDRMIRVTPESRAKDGSGGRSAPSASAAKLETELEGDTFESWPQR